MVNVARIARQRRLRAAHFTTQGRIAAASSSGALHFYPELSLCRDAAEPVTGFGPCRNSRRLEPDGLALFCFPDFDHLEPDYGWGTGPVSEATHWTVFGQEVQK